MTGRRPLRPEAQLAALLEGLDPTPDWLDGFLSENPREGLHHEYKSALVLEKSEAPRTVREYVSAFANSAGGVLLFGVADNTRLIEGCAAPRGGTLEEWATRSLLDLAPFLSPPPRIATVDHPDGTVLLIAVARAPALVPVVHGGRLAYFLRIGDATVPAPEYLLSDLMLGHRQHPVLTPALTMPAFTSSGMTLNLAINNEGLSTARGVLVGVVAFVGPGATPNSPAPPALIPFVRRNPEKTGTLVHDARVLEVLRPFHSEIIRLGPFQHLFRSSTMTPWRAGLYILTESSPPTWYQLDHPGRLSTEPSLQRVTGSQGPFVGWERP